MQWLEFQADAPAPHTVGGGSVADISLNRTGWTARLGCGLGASMLWTDSIGEPVQWATYDAVLDGFGPVSVLPNLPSFQAIHSGDLDGDGREDLILWHGDDMLSWYGNLIEGPTEEVLITAFDTLCNAAVPYVLDQAQQAGGTWTGVGVQGDVFTPSEAGVFDLVYTLIDEDSGCPYSGARSIVVIDLPTVTADTALNDLCATGQIQLTGIPSGGAWSGAANAFGVIDNDTLSRPFQGGIFYTYTDASGSTCENGQLYQLQSYSTLGYTTPGPFCFGDALQTFLVFGPLLGGVGVTGNGIVDVVPTPPTTTVTFDPSVGFGYHEIVLTSMSPMHCVTIVLDSILVDCTVGLDIPTEQPEALQIYPSPAHGPVTISGRDPANVQFIDASGRLVLTISNVQPGSPIDVSSLQRGLYTVIALANGERRVGRVVIE